MFISIKNVSKIYNNSIKALDNIDLEIEESEIFGLLGVNGSGKKTLSSILATLIPSTKGNILYKGKSIYENINQYRKIIGFCPQHPNLDPLLNVYQNLYLDGIYYGFSEKESKKKVEELSEKLELNDYLESNPMILSGGYKQRVMIARCLMHNPKFIILDEPTVGLDPTIRQNLWKIIKKLKSDGITVLLTTHYLDEAEKLSDRICVLDKGKILLIDTPENLMKKHKKVNLEEVFIKLTTEEA